MGVSVYKNKARDNYRAQVKHNGITKTKTFKKKDEANAWGYDYLSQIKRGDASGFRDSASVAEVLDLYIQKKAPQLKGDGYRNKQLIVKQLKEEPFSKLCISDLKSGSIVKYKDALISGGLADSTVRHKIVTLSVAIDYYIETHDSDIRNPCDKVKRPESHKGKREKILTEAAESWIFNPLKTENYQVWLAATFGINTGMRRAEIASLRYIDLDFKTKHIYVPAGVTKNSKARKIPINDELLIHIYRYQTHPIASVANRELKLFTISKETISRVFTKASKGEYRFHDLRHTFLTRLGKTGLSVFKMMKISGHTTTRQLENYIHDDSSLEGCLNSLKDFA